MVLRDDQCPIRANYPVQPATGNVVAIVVAVMVVVVVHDQKRCTAMPVRIVQFGIENMCFQTVALLLLTSTFVFEADVLVLYFCS